MTSEAIQQKHSSGVNTWLDKPIFKVWPSFSIEKLILILIIVLAIVSRLYDVGARVMAHDEVNHVVPSYELYQGRGYRYDPVTHGPFQFHMIAVSYFIFGDSDFSSRIPAALFGIAVVLFALFAWRKYLGRVGSLLAGLFFLISPYMLFYSRYTRNEIFIVFWGSVMLWLFLRYLECGEKKYL
ncbi:MAG: glycosyltransferase family 39 protein, partial [Anaerolineaceae bacterium]|nr:glycosyltransferase family 39 protein [Anaerolineaceae bacterium]